MDGTPRKKLLGSIAVNEFAQHQQATLPLKFELNINYFWKLQALNFLQSAEDTIKFFAESCHSWRPGYVLPSRQKVDAKTALSDFHNGATIYISNLHRRHLLFQQMSDEISSLLGIPRHTVDAQAFLNPANSDVPLHYDHDDNINILLRGKKEWTLSPRSDSTLETSGKFFHEMTAEEQSSEVFQMSHSEAVTRTGFYVPRGYWHQTHSKSECFAISFAIRPPYAFEVFLKLLAAELHQHSECNAFHYPAINEESNMQNLSNVLERAKEVVSRMTVTPREFSQGTEVSRFKVNPNKTKDITVWSAKEYEYTKQSTPLVVHEDAADTVSRILNYPDIFTLDAEFARQFNCGISTLKSLIKSLIKAGLILQITNETAGTDNE